MLSPFDTLRLPLTAPKVPMEHSYQCWLTVALRELWLLIVATLIIPNTNLWPWQVATIVLLEKPFFILKGQFNLLFYGFSMKLK